MSNRQIVLLVILFDFACWAVILYGIYWLIRG